MKKIFLILGVFFASLTVNAAYLYWQVADYGTEGTDWDAVSVYIYDINNKTVLYNDPGKLNNYDGETSIGKVIRADDGSLAGSSFVASVDDSYVGNGYSYYVEYYKYNSDYGDNSYTVEHKVAGGINQSTTAQTTYDSTKVTLSDFTTSGWATPSTYTAVPEPTSGLLMLFGAAMLGLKRKNRSRA